MDAKIFRVNYKSDFILTLESDAGWMTPFCIKFWTGAPSQAYYVGWDGTTYNHCAYDPSEPTKLQVQFDDHHLPIGELKFQIAYHFTVADFPNDTEDEVINPANITTEIDGETYQVMLDFTGETAPEIQFSLPAYANEAQRIANEQQRIANEQARISQEQSRVQAEQQRVQQENARVVEFGNIQSQANDDHLRANEDHSVAIDDHRQAVSDHGIAVDDHTQAGNDHTRAESDHSVAVDDHTQAGNDHTRAESDHGIAVDDHTQAGNDHTRAESDHSTAASDHTQAGNDHTRAESDHTRAESDHAAVEVFVDSLGVFDLSKHNAVNGVLATYANLSAALTALNALESKYKYGGMSFKFVQSSDNKYVQFRCISDEFTTDVTQWQGADKEPAPGSINFVESNALYSEFFDIDGTLNGFKSIELPITFRNLPVRYDGSEQSDNNFKGYSVDLSIYTKYNTIEFYADGQNDTSASDRVIPAVFKDVNGNILKYIEGTSPKTYSSEIPTGAVLIECSYNQNYPIPTSVTIYSQEDEGLIEKVSDLSAQVNANTEEIETMQKDLSELEDINPIDTYYHSPLNLLNYNDPDFATGKTINSSGNLRDSSSNNTSPYIQVEYGKKYALVSSGNVRTCRYLAYYDSNKGFISRVEYATIFEIKNHDAVFVRVSVSNSYMKPEHGMFIEVTNPNNIPYIYRAYFEPYSVNALKPEYVPTFGSFRANGTLQTEERLSTPIVHVTKNMLLTAVVNGICSDVKIGVSSSPTADGDYTRYIRLTATEVDVCDDDGTSISGYPKLHGLSLGNRCAVKLTKGITRTSAALQITNEFGDIFDDTPDWPIRVGGAFIENNGEATINAGITFMPKDINKDVWLLGGSYYSLGDPARWISYAIHNDDYNWLLDAKPGITIGGTKKDLKNLLSLGCKPKYALIHVGANGGLNDTKNSINETWLMHMQDILGICQENNIIPVVFTVPNTPTRYNVKKNEWLRSSGIRLVDMNEALGCDSDFYWKGWGTDNALLSSDQVHPTIRGAKVIASCVYRDFPEIATNGK